MTGYDRRRKLLYYPSIDIPNRQWLRQAVLYWDVVSSIVPQQYFDEHPKTKGAHIEYLQSEGQYEPCDPAFIVNGSAADSVMTEFALLIEPLKGKKGFDDVFRPIFNVFPTGRANESWIVGLPASMVPLPWPGQSRLVHTKKVSGEVLRLLTQEGLVSSNLRGTWTRWHPVAALIYISLLAKYMASESNDNISVGTDISYLQEFIVGPSSARQVADFPTASGGNKSVTLKAQMLDLLPVPRQDVPLENIVNFKRQRRDELLRLRKELDVFYARLSESEDREQIKDIVTSSKEEIELGISDLRRTLADAKIGFWTGLTEGTMQLKMPGWMTGVTLGGLTYAGSLPLSTPIIGTILGGVVTIGVIYGNWLISRNTTIRHSPYAYLYSASAEGITP
ncbi:MAG: DUF6236 family protein [Caldilineaceae bacterium]